MDAAVRARLRLLRHRDRSESADVSEKPRGNESRYDQRDGDGERENDDVQDEQTKRVSTGTGRENAMGERDRFAVYSVQARTGVENGRRVAA